MPTRPFSRAQTWLLPPTLDELVPPDHSARFVAALVDGLGRAAWAELGIAPDGEARGAPEYAPRVLLGAWLYGFMTGVRSTRELELACRERLPFLWLTGGQRPDHNTLWRFYQAHRSGLRRLFRRTVRAAVRLGLVDLALQAVDGTKVAGNAARGRTLNARELAALLARVDAAIAALEAQAQAGAPTPPTLPAALARQAALRERVAAALATVSAADGPPWTNLTDPDTVLIQGRQGKAAGYNGQVMVSPLAPAQAGRPGRLVTAEALVDAANDHGQLVPLLEQARAHTDAPAAVTLADSGYHSGPDLERCAALGQTVIMPDGQQRPARDPFHKDAFVYEPATDTYRCPQGQPLHYAGPIQRPGGEAPARRYRAAKRVCDACPVRAACTPSTTRGRTIGVRADDAALRAHRARMAEPTARALYRQRKGLVEGVFGILKERLGARRLLLRGLRAARAEWSLLVTALNLRTLGRVWQGWPPERRAQLVLALAA